MTPIFYKIVCRLPWHLYCVKIYVDCHGKCINHQNFCVDNWHFKIYTVYRPYSWNLKFNQHTLKANTYGDNNLFSMTNQYCQRNLLVEFTANFIIGKWKNIAIYCNYDTQREKERVGVCLRARKWICLHARESVCVCQRERERWCVKFNIVKYCK